MRRVTDALRERATVAAPAVQRLREQPLVSVGIVSSQRLVFSLNAPYSAKGITVEGEQTVTFSEGGIMWNGKLYRELAFAAPSADATFSIKDVVIGKNFHWQRNQTQTFKGILRLVVESDEICAINELPVEDYLASVISSEMNAQASEELLKAHAVISRSWLLAQMERRRKVGQEGGNFFSFVRKDDEILRWYDREDHAIFDVCADDHCQRYQGVTTPAVEKAVKAVKATKGQVLTCNDEICDARFSKCCGGATEEFQYCWDNIRKPYLLAVRDADSGQPLPDLTVEENAVAWIKSCPEAFCHTDDKKILSQVLRDYDQETTQFYRPYQGARTGGARQERPVGPPAHRGHRAHHHHRQGVGDTQRALREPLAQLGLLCGDRGRGRRGAAALHPAWCRMGPWRGTLPDRCCRDGRERISL